MDEGSDDLYDLLIVSHLDKYLMCCYAFDQKVTAKLKMSENIYGWYEMVINLPYYGSYRLTGAGM